MGPVSDLLNRLGNDMATVFDVLLPERFLPVGDGYGCGYGDGDGDGYGDGYGDGDGDGCGSGYGSGRGYGNGNETVGIKR